MRILINQNEVNIPSSLAEITLKQRIDFQKQHGDELLEIKKSIMEMDDEDQRELEALHVSFEEMFRTFSFFSGVPVEVIKESEFIDKIANIYHSCLACLNEDNSEMELQQEFIWNDEVWVIDKPELKNGDRMTFGEFIDSKQIISDMIKLGKNQWECMLNLCAIFLRRKDEPYHESFCYEGSDRLALMETLPMSIAIQVGFFLSGSLNLLTKAFQSSGLQELKAEVSI